MPKGKTMSEKDMFYLPPNWLNGKETEREVFIKICAYARWLRAEGFLDGIIHYVVMKKEANE